MDELTAEITLNFTKAHKFGYTSSNESPCHFIEAIKDEGVLCVVKLLLVVAIRTGQIRSLTDALRAAATSPDGTISWLWQDRPVLFHYTQQTNAVYHRAASIDQLVTSLRVMAADAGLGGSFVTHDIRRGAACDSVQLQSAGIAVQVVAAALGHHAASSNNGTTLQYIGRVVVHNWNRRVQNR